MVEQRIQHALRSETPPASLYRITPGDLVRVFREELRKWIGPVEVVKVERKQIHVSNRMKVKCFIVAQLMPVAIHHRTIDDDLERLFTHNDAVAEREQ